MKIDRSKFVYELGDYGTTTDMYLLPVGTRFSVYNGAWDGEITESDGKKFLYVEATKMSYELTEKMDCGLVVRIKEQSVKRQSVTIDIQEIISMQYKVLATTDRLLDANGKELDKDFRRRVFENIEYLQKVEKVITWAIKYLKH